LELGRCDGRPRDSDAEGWRDKAEGGRETKRIEAGLEVGTVIAMDFGLIFN
jgi:hypothetical protein